MNKSIFIDLDGTFLTDNDEITKKNKVAIERAIQMGYRVYIITGKSFNGAIKFYDQLKLRTTLVTLGGQEHYEPSLKGFKKIAIEIKDSSIKEIISEFKKNVKVNNFMVANRNGSFFAMKIEDSNLISLFSGSDKIVLLNNKNKIKDIVSTYIEIDEMDNKIIQDFINEIKAKYIDVDFFIWNTQGNLPIVYLRPSSISKLQSMKNIIKKDKIEFSIAFGNGVSDIEMLRGANIGVAMKNATTDVKDAANYITKKDNNNSGVGTWIENNLFDI